MLESVKISRRQSEIRQALAALVGKTQPTDDETRSMETMDSEYRQNEIRYRASLIAEDGERREAGRELETRGGAEWAKLIDRFEVRQVALFLDEGAALSGPTAEVVTELRSRGGYRGVPVPWAALSRERRSGETIASGVASPTQTMPIVDRLFVSTVAGLMGAQFMNIDAGLVEWPVVTSTVAAAWANGEIAAVGSPQAFATTERSVDPSNTFGVQMKISRKALKQLGGVEDAVRRDMLSAISVGLDNAAFNGTGSSGEPLGIIYGASTYGITETDAGAASTWSDFQQRLAAFITSGALAGTAGVRLAVTPDIWTILDAALFDAGSGITEWDKLLRTIPNPVITPQMPAGKSLFTVTKDGVAPFTVATWGAVDMIRDPYSDAASGGLRLTGLVTADIAVLRPQQIQIVEDLGS